MRTSSRAGFVAGLAAGVIAVAGAASAQSASPSPEPERPGARFEVDARLGVALPSGDLANKVPASDNVSMMVPFGVGAGVRWPSGTYLGAYFSYGILAMKHGGVACPAGWTRCTGHDVRLGAEMLFHLRSRKPVDPWFGFGFGYEWLTYHASLAQSAGELTDTVTIEGYEYLNLQLGIDFALRKALTLGPVLTFTFASYGDLTAERTGSATSPSTSQGIASGFHTWVFVGARGSFSFL